MSESHEMSKALIRGQIVDSLQYWNSALDYLDTATVDLQALRNVFQQYAIAGDEWHQILQSQGSVDFGPSVRTSYFGVQVSGNVAITMVVRSLIHHLHQALDSMAQFVNAAALGDSRLDLENVTIAAITSQVKKHGGFNELATELDSIMNDSSRFQYLVDLDNVLKHIVAVDPDLTWYIFQNSVEAFVPGFQKRDRRGTRSYPRKPLLTTAEELVGYVSNALKNFENVVTTGCGIKWHPAVSNRCHDVSYYIQFDDKEGKRVTGAAQYVAVSTTPRHGEVFRVLSVSEAEVEGVTSYTFRNVGADIVVLRDHDKIPVAIAHATGTIAQQDELPMHVYREYRVTATGPITPPQFHQVLAETKQVTGSMERVSCGLPANSFPADILPT